MVRNVFWNWKATGLKVSKVLNLNLNSLLVKRQIDNPSPGHISKLMGIQNQEEHIGHVKQLKSDRYQDRKFFFQA